MGKEERRASNSRRAPRQLVIFTLLPAEEVHDDEARRHWPFREGSQTLSIHRMNEGAEPGSGWVARVLRGVGWVVAGLALTLLTAWAGAYFALGSSPGRAWLGELAAEALPRSVNVGLVKWGPSPGEVAIGELVVRAPAGRELLAMRSASAAVSLGALLDGEVVVDRLEVELTRVEAAAGEEGRIDLAEALRPPKVATAVGAGPPKATKQPEIKALNVVVHELWLDLGGEQVHVRDLGLAGALHANGAGAFEVRSGPCHAAWNKLRRVVGFTGCRLTMSVEGQRAVVEALSLGREDGEVLAMRGWMDMSGEPRGSWTATGTLGPDDTGALMPAMFPAGLAFDGLALELVGSRLSGRLGQVFAERWVSGPLSADHASFGVPSFTAEPGLLVPEMTLVVEGLSAARLEGLDWRLEGLWIPGATGKLDRKLVVDANGWGSQWTLPTGEVGPVDIEVTALLKLTGGQLIAQVQSELGVVEALGTLKSSPLTKHTDFIANVAFTGARGPLAAAFMHELDDAQRTALGEPIAGAVELDVEVDRKDRLGPFTTTLEWALGRLDGKVSLEWDGYGWGAPPPPDPEADPDADEVEPP